MIFMLADKEPVLVCFLLPEDLAMLRQGNTVFVDQRQLQGRAFEQVVLSLHRSREEVMETLRSGGKLEGKKFVVPQPHENEGKCEGCECITQRNLLYRGRCIVCWYRAALDAMGGQGN